LLVAHYAQGRAAERDRITATGARHADAQHIGLGQRYSHDHSQHGSDAGLAQQGIYFE
jgi:hypothetical protein